jgi:cytochrome b561
MVLILVIFVVILLAALRIILGWFLPKKTVTKIDNAISRATKLYLQLIVVIIAGLILWGIVASMR